MTGKMEGANREGFEWEGNYAKVSLDLIENEIRRFLSTDEPEAISISGHWGVGKTFAWRRYLEDAQR
jgi:hypothetical protein